jgi:hypothetical protein
LSLNPIQNQKAKSRAKIKIKKQNQEQKSKSKSRAKIKNQEHTFSQLFYNIGFIKLILKISGKRN